MHIHLDPVGGVAGDMFAGALLDLWPELFEDVVSTLRAAGIGPDVSVGLHPHDDGLLTGSRFVIGLATAPPSAHHIRWCDLRRDLECSALAAPVRERALAIFTVLAEAEAGVHGRTIEEVTFHEVGAVDSLADIVTAAHLIEALGAARWSVGPLPLGSGRVRAAHGELPVPAPAVLRLIEGFPCADDGRWGERVTPTGAAILRHLDPAFGLGPETRHLVRSGQGFGLRRFEGLSNVLRALVFEPASATRETIAVLRFEVDDQTPEDLALALDHLRALDGVLDVLHAPVIGKKGRMAMSVQILTHKDQREPVLEACFDETTTLGVRVSLEERRVLERSEVLGPGDMRVKVAARSRGPTAKAECDDLRGTRGHAVRRARRQEAEAAALGSGPSAAAEEM